MTHETGLSPQTRPHSVEAEESLLGAMLMSGDATAAGLRLCRSSDFYVPRHRRIFGAIAALAARGEPVDYVTTLEELRRTGEIACVGDGSDLVGLQANTPSVGNASQYAEIIAGHARLRSIQEDCRELEDAATAGDVDRIRTIVDGLAAAAVAGPGDLSALDVRAIADVIAEVASAPAPLYLVRSVIAAGDHGMLGAEFKAGKTWLFTDLMVSVASGTPWLGIFEVEAPGSVLLFAGEGGARKLTRRFHAVCEGRGLDLAALPIRICLRVPQLTSEGAMVLVADEIARHRPQLVGIDPLYLAASGARGADLYEMGAHLQRIQHVCQDVGAALMISHHWNKTGTGRGAKRMSGAGPDAWGRVLISADVVSRNTDPESKASDVVLDLDFQGDEIPETTVRIRRRVWADDPDDLASPLHYGVARIESAKLPADPTLAGLRPSARRVLEILEGPPAGEAGHSVREIGDLLAVDGQGQPLRTRTIQDALKALHEAGLARSDTSAGQWHSTRAHAPESQAGNDL